MWWSWFPKYLKSNHYPFVVQYTNQGFFGRRKPPKGCFRGFVIKDPEGRFKNVPITLTDFWKRDVFKKISKEEMEHG
jgi:hypothetical protein